MWLFFLLVACAAAGLSCARVCRRAFAAAQVPGAAAQPPRGTVPDPRALGPDGAPELTLYETAYLSGGPHRLADVVLVLMARQRRLLVAHTGWATVVDPVGHDAVEDATLTAIGPEGQRPIPAIRGAFATADEVRALSDRLVTSGLALPADVRTGIGQAIRQVKGATVLVLLSAAAAVWMAPSGTEPGPLLAWFALPLILTTGTWAMARAEIHPYTHWATAAGERMLRRVAAGPEGRARATLTALAIHGPGALSEPALRAALHSSGA